MRDYVSINIMFYRFQKEEENEAQEEKRRAISPDSKAKFIQ